MLKNYTSECYALDEQVHHYERTEEQVNKLALASAMFLMARLIRAEAYRGEVDMPASIRVEVIKQYLDVQVRLWPEKGGEKDAVS